MKVDVIEHCIKQIKMRKQKQTDEEALMFATETFRQMIKMKYCGTECKIRNGYCGREVIYHRETGYKFVFKRESSEHFTLITFALHTNLDFEIGKLIKRLVGKSSDSRSARQKASYMEGIEFLPDNVTGQR